MESLAGGPSIGSAHLLASPPKRYPSRVAHGGARNPCRVEFWCQVKAVMETAAWMPLIIAGSLMRETPPAARMSAGMRSSAITAHAPAASAIFACSGNNRVIENNGGAR